MHSQLRVRKPNPLQPRKAFDEEALIALAESVKERGVVQPVLVRPTPGGTYGCKAGPDAPLVCSTSGEYTRAA